MGVVPRRQAMRNSLPSPPDTLLSRKRPKSCTAGVHLTVKNDFNSASSESLRLKVRSTLRFLHDNIEHIESAPPGDSQADKAACEVLLLCWGLHRNRDLDPEAARLIERIVTATDERLRSQAIVRGLLWKPSLAPMLCTGSALLADMGRANPRFEGIARSAWRDGFVESVERSPFQVLETQWVAGFLGVAHLSGVPPDSLLFHKPRPMMMRSEDAYAFTHSIFYTTNFGRGAPPTAADRRGIWDVIAAGVAWSLARFDFDLLGEFLLCALFYDMPYTPSIQLGLHTLLTAWEEYGMVPDRAIVVGERGVDGKELFQSIYHANLVAAYLANELLVRKLDPSGPTVELPSSLLSLQHLHAQLDGWTGDTLARSASVEGPRMDTLLENIVGRSIAGSLFDSLPESVLRRVYPDLVTAHGFLTQDTIAVLAGVQAALDDNVVSWTIVCAIEWLIMFHEMLRGLDGQDTPVSRKVEELLVSARELVSQ